MKTEAQRLAEILCKGNHECVDFQAAAELRRLDTLVSELIQALEFCAGTSYITDAHQIAEDALELVRNVNE